MGDILSFENWGNHLDVSIFKYLDTPKESFATFSLLQVFITLLFIAVQTWIGFFILNKIFLPPPSLSPLTYFLSMILLILPIRGNVGRIPINQSDVFFSSNRFANLVSINAPWNFFFSIYKNEIKENPYVFFNPTELEQKFSYLHLPRNKIDPPFKLFREDLREKPNIIFIIWESFTGKIIGRSWQNQPIVPHFENLIHEGIYFDNYFANAHRTDKAITSIFSGYPTLPNFSILTVPSKSLSLFQFPSVLKNAGYTTSFNYGGRLEFANMWAYLKNGSFTHIQALDDFPQHLSRNSWGIYDHDAFKYLGQDILKIPQPFFFSFLTLTSHEPFDLPDDLNYQNSLEERFVKAMRYTDNSLNDFINQLKTSSLWNNSWIIIQADHGHRAFPSEKISDDFKVPMLWLGGALHQDTPKVWSAPSSQLDLGKTILEILNLDSSQLTWSKNIFDTTFDPWAFFSFNNAFGLIFPHGEFIFDNGMKKVAEQLGTITPEQINAGKALEQKSFDDFLSR